MTLLSSLNKIVDLLGDGLNNNDWNLISEAYELFTGEVIEVKSQDPSDMLAMMMQRLEKLENTKQTSNNKKKDKTKQEDKKESNFSVESNRKSRKVTDRKVENKFDRMQDIIAEAGREEGFDRINDNVKPSDRSRRPYQPKMVKCSECNSDHEVHPLFARDNYTCDRCIQRRGG
jgi:hypothetical protein